MSEQCGRCGRWMAFEREDRLGFLIWKCVPCRKYLVKHRSEYEDE